MESYLAKLVSLIHERALFLHVSKTKHYLQCSLTQHYQILPAIERQALVAFLMAM